MTICHYHLILFTNNSFFIFNEDDYRNLLEVLSKSSGAIFQPVKDPKYSRKSEILNIDIIGKSAIVKVKTIVNSTENTLLYADFLSFLKIKNTWQIVSKIYDKEILE